MVIIITNKIGNFGTSNIFKPWLGASGSDPSWNSATLWQVRGFCVIKRDFQHAFDAKRGFIIFDLSNEAGR